MSRPQNKTPGAGGRSGAGSFITSLPARSVSQHIHNAQLDRANQRRAAGQVARLRLIARCLSLSAVFVGDHPLHAELFDRHGRRVESWVWP